MGYRDCSLDCLRRPESAGSNWEAAGNLMSLATSDQRGAADKVERLWLNQETHCWATARTKACRSVWSWLRTCNVDRLCARMGFLLIVEAGHIRLRWRSLVRRECFEQISLSTSM